MIIRLLFLFTLLVTHAHAAGLINISLQDKDHKLAPASDLVYQGNRINEVEAMELEKSGVDLSKLDPYESDLFHPGSVIADPKPVAVKEVTFHSFLESPTEFFRFVSKSGDTGFTATASLFNQETMVRANLLRKIGFKVPAIFFRQELIVRFDSLAAMDLFSQKIVESTLLSKKKWVAEENKTELYLKLKGVILEPSDSNSVPVYWPIMEETRQRKRRVFRSLLYLYSLTDFNMPINEITWSPAKVFNNELIISHHYADEFSSVSAADLKWIHRKILSIPMEKLCGGLSEANYPQDISELLCEKLKSRINSFGRALGLASPLKVNEHVGSGQVHDGKLTSGNYPDYVPVFWVEDPESPYRFSEVFKYFRTQVTYDTISSALDTAEKAYLPNATTDEATNTLIERIRAFGKQNGKIPLKMWTTPTFGGSVGGNRSIIFGKYEGSDAPIQLVDTLSLKLQVGLFSYLTIPGSPVSPTGTLNAQVVRRWNHIRAMPDLSTATKQKIQKLLIPKLYHSLGNLLKTEPLCSLQNDAWVTEEIVAGISLSIVYYDQNVETAKDSALKLREDLIAKGTPKNKILLKPALKSDLCVKEITEKRNKNVDEFLKSFAANETLTITDSLETRGGVGIKVSDGIVDGLKVRAGVEAGYAILRSYIIRKTATGIEITIQNRKDLSGTFFQEAKFFISLMSNSSELTRGDLHSKVYRVDFDETDDEQKKIAIQVLREVFLRSSYGLLVDNYNPITMDHDANVKINTFKFLWRKNENLKMNHEVSVLVPNRETKREIPKDTTVNDWTIPAQTMTDLPEAKRTKNLFSTMAMRRSGSNYHVFLNKILNDQVSWLSTGAQDSDPGESVKGTSNHRYVMTEGDLTPGFEFNPVTKIEYGNLGWSASMKKLEKILRLHEGYLATQDGNFTLDRTIFDQTTLLRSYTVRTTLILYPVATQKLLHSLLESDEVSSLTLLKSLYGETEWDRYCKQAEADVGDDSSWVESSTKRGMFFCVPRELISILDMRKDGIAKKRQDLGEQINKVVKTLITNVQTKNLLSWIGKDNFFGNTFISGFRNGDAVGYTQYASDSVGTYDQVLQTGIFDQVAAILGVQGYDLKAMVYTPNM